MARVPARGDRIDRSSFSRPGAVPLPAPAPSTPLWRARAVARETPEPGVRGEPGLARPVVAAGARGEPGPSREIAPDLAMRALMLLAVVLALLAERADRADRADATDSCWRRLADCLLYTSPSPRD